jgi:hypothetical protein
MRCPWASAAMRHARYHEEPHRLINGLAIGLSLCPRGHGIVVVDGFPRRNQPVGPSVVEKEFVSVGAKGIEIRIGGIQCAGKFLRKSRVLMVEIELLPIPIRPKYPLKDRSIRRDRSRTGNPV